MVKCDQMLLGGDLGRVAMTCGTTSTVIYMHGADCHTACCGDSRAVKVRGRERARPAPLLPPPRPPSIPPRPIHSSRPSRAAQGSRKDGALVSHDLSFDHKPDLPEERKRIVAAGGTVSDGSAGRPARVWASGRIGLAMSRSLGDGECKAVGVIPDPSLSHTLIAPPERDGADGDLFIIVASDGVWEFIESLEACQIVANHANATEACTALVQEAVSRWKKFEGSYRDDITAIVALLPFLESGWADEESEDEQPAAAGEGAGEGAEDEEPIEVSTVFLNMGKKGLSAKSGLVQSVGAATASAPAADGAAADGEAAKAGEEKEFAARRLSVHNPFDENWNDGAGDDDDDDDDGDGDAAAKK